MKQAETKPSKLRTAAKWIFRLVLVGLIIIAAFTAWFVTGPANDTYQVDKTGIPQGTWPKLTAATVQDLPLSCSFVAQDGVIPGDPRRPHRNHTYLARHNGEYFVMFSFWYGAEGGPDQEVRFATSNDGVSWTKPELLAAPAPEHGLVARGFVSRDGKLFAQYATHTGKGVFRDHDLSENKNLALLESQWDEEARQWSPNRMVIDKLATNYPAWRFDETLVMALRDSDRETYLATSDDDGLTWSVGNKMPHPAKPIQGEKGLYLADEPITYDYAGGKALVLLRNNNSADGRLWAAPVEGDDWGAPFPLEFASDASKFFPVKLTDGHTAMIGNFDPDVRRALLHIAVSEDGRDFDQLYRLSLGGQYGRLRWRSPQYPHAIVDDQTMLLGVSYGKRAISVCKGPATSAALADASEFRLAPRIASGICSKNHPTILRRLFGYAGCVEHFVWG